MSMSMNSGPSHTGMSMSMSMISGPSHTGMSMNSARSVLSIPKKSIRSDTSSTWGQQ